MGSPSKVLKAEPTENAFSRYVLGSGLQVGYGAYVLILCHDVAICLAGKVFSISPNAC